MEKYIDVLYKLVKRSYIHGEVPIGAIVINNGLVVGKGYNTRQFKKNVLGHAEIMAILEAERRLKDWRLNGCILITTLEPCQMCYEVIKACRISKVYYLIDRKNSLSYPQGNFEKLYFPGNKKVDLILKMFNDFFVKLR